ncbi:MAG: DUF2853 family protein [Gammaproteobacteria bacterium]|nr:DUF2853 family protein [Gammaproteobacteria bacterium]
MSKFDEAITECKTQMESCNIECDEQLLKAICKGLGPSLYNRDSFLVAAADPKEIENIKTRFLHRKLRVDSVSENDAAIAHAIQTLGESNRQKCRPVFYYLLVKFLNKESVYA